MPLIRFDAVQWDDADNPAGNVAHIAAHDLTPSEVESALRSPSVRDGRSASSGRRMAFGRTDTDRYIAVVYSLKQTRTAVAIRVITAYDVAPY